MEKINFKDLGITTKSPFIQCVKKVGIFNERDILSYQNGSSWNDEGFNLNFSMLNTPPFSKMNNEFINNMGGKDFLKEHFTTNVDWASLEKMIIESCNIDLSPLDFKKYFIFFQLKYVNISTKQYEDEDLNRWYREFLTNMGMSVICKKNNLLQSNTIGTPVKFIVYNEGV